MLWKYVWLCKIIEGLIQVNDRQVSNRTSFIKSRLKQTARQIYQVPYKGGLAPYLGDLVDVKELGKLYAEHVCGQSDGPPPSLTDLNEPGSSPTTED